MDTAQLHEALFKVRAALESEDYAAARQFLQQLNSADLAEVIGEDESDQTTASTEQLNESPSTELNVLDAEETAEFLEQLDSDDAAALAGRLPLETLSEVLEEMQPDDAADLLQYLPEAQAAAVLAEMHPDQAGLVRPLLSYEDDTAGGIMTPRLPVLRGWMTVSQSIHYLRSLHPDSNQHYYLYVVDRDSRLIGIVGLRDMIVADSQTSIGSLMNRDVVMVTADTPQSECAQLLSRYGLLALPVVDANGRLVGTITHDDLVEVLEEEGAADLYGLANMSTDTDLDVFSPFKLMVEKRLPWLLVNLATAFLASGVASLFSATIAKLAMLSALQSIVAGMGGNSGTQALAIMIRGIAVGELEFKHTWRVLLREIGLGVVHGIVIGLVVGMATWAWQGKPILGLVIGLACLGNLVVAGLAGTLVPITLKAVKLDPALASAVILTTATDSIGFFLFLGLATLFLPYLQ